MWKVWKWKVKGKSLSCVWLFTTPWTIAFLASLAMESSRQEYWIGLPSTSPGDLPDLGIKPGSPALQADSLPTEPLGRPMWKVCYVTFNVIWIWLPRYTVLEAVLQHWGNHGRHMWDGEAVLRKAAFCSKAEQSKTLPSVTPDCTQFRNIPG